MEFKPSSYQAEVQDIVKEYDAWDEAQTRPDVTQEEVQAQNSLLVAKGRLDPRTGVEIPVSSKARVISRFIPSSRFKKNFDGIKWDTRCHGSVSLMIAVVPFDEDVHQGVSQEGCQGVSRDACPDVFQYAKDWYSKGGHCAVL